MIEATYSSETFEVQQITFHYVAEDRILHNDGCGNPKQYENLSISRIGAFHFCLFSVSRPLAFVFHGFLLHFVLPKNIQKELNVAQFTLV